MTEDQLILKVTEHLKKVIFEKHLSSSAGKNTKLKSYNVNPIVVKYLAKILQNDFSPLGVAKALLLSKSSRNID
ncbi:hypothetical protein GW756_02600 [bacterium]|nr:hypothetical protein [bacterium]NCQ55894.1 hypothetical protein [Candidatus Parcubacteria bacterium]NCS67602.1 hypothetical protein [Candidatus Peregrinibacteria bacterium]NCS96233.1 hypothetical protein [bacterium]